MVDVAAAVFKDGQGRILICRRGPGGDCAYLWEFPGGKRNGDESFPDCLKRECREELGVEISVGDIICETVYEYPHLTVRLKFFESKVISGDISMNVHTCMRKVSPDELKDYTFCPADRKVVKILADR